MKLTGYTSLRISFRQSRLVGMPTDLFAMLQKIRVHTIVHVTVKMRMPMEWRIPTLGEADPQLRCVLLGGNNDVLGRVQRMGFLVHQSAVGVDDEIINLADVVLVCAPFSRAPDERLRALPIIVLGDVPSWTEHAGILLHGDASDLALHKALRTGAEQRRLRRFFALSKTALGQAGIAVAVCDAQHAHAPLVFVSSSFSAMTGYASEQAVGQSFRLLQGPDTSQVELESLCDAIAQRVSQKFRLLNYRKDGSRFWNEVRLFPVPDGSTRPRYVGALLRDVSDLISAEQAHEKIRAQFLVHETLTQGALNGVPMAVIVTNQALEVGMINKAACELLELDGEKIVGRGLIDALAITPQAATSLIQHVQGESYTLECSYVLATQPPREIGISMAPALDRVGYCLVLRDLADIRRAERVERLAAVSTMAAGFAHEVRNPLASVRMLAEGLNDMVGGDDARELVMRILDQVLRVERLVKTSLQFAQPERPRQGHHWPSVIVNRAVEALRPRLSRLPISEINLNLSEQLPKVCVDEAQLVQVLVVLLNNALDATKTPEDVRLSVSRYWDDRAAQEWVNFSVDDDGPGIPEHLRAAVFHPFFTTKPAGTGLGLSIAQQLVIENGGRMELGASLSGARFSVLVKPVVS